MGPLQIVWFKRDLRAFDHHPLLEASPLGPVLPLLVVEPELWRQPDASARQWAFYAESIQELRQALAQLGQPLVVRVGSVTTVLERARRQFGIAALWSHQETGNGWTYDRDRAVASWARLHGIVWTEIAPFGVFRRLVSRDGWARRWEARMAEPLAPAPPSLTPLATIDPGPIPTAADLVLASDPCPLRQRGGRSEGLALLGSFLSERGARYHRDLSSPSSAARGCSRLSPHLAWGTLSLREVVQASRARRQGLGQRDPAERAEWPRALRGFEERLHWHCHFIQKLECQPDLEFRSLHPLGGRESTLAEAEPAVSGIFEAEPPEGIGVAEGRFAPPAPGDGPGSGQAQAACERLAAWAEGRTGLPFVDACMRSLIASGWLNFRMRAMLMSVACHHLDLGWRDCGLVLARLFVDYEPGIHWSQCQMQAGSTGINTIRIYNPIKQGQDHDPQGLFLRRWLPELAAVPLIHLHEPWTMAASLQLQIGCVLGVSYPLPIVDPVAAAREARERLWGRRQQPGFGAWADAIQQRHGSRRSGLIASAGRNRSRKARNAGADNTIVQLGLDLQLDGSQPLNLRPDQLAAPSRRTVT
jgi:deoxyribodipyrimidine photo-lyase